MLWLLASEYDDGRITAAPEEIAFRLRTSEVSFVAAVKPLIDGGFFIAASNTLAACEQVAIPEKRREREETYREEEEENAREVRALSVPSTFDEFWQLYPNKVGKSAAQKAFVRALKFIPFPLLMTGLRVYVDKADDRPWCNPTTWLNQGRWDDQPREVIKHGKTGNILPAADQLIERIADFDRPAPEQQRELCGGTGTFALRAIPSRGR
jgi:hypothetical protein